MTLRPLPALFATLLCLSAPTIMAHAQGAGSGPKIEFTAESHDFGNLAYKGNGSAGIAFKNTGSAPLVITSVTSSCGCVVPSWTREPVMPGQAGEVRFRYDTSRSGAFSKTLTVASNAQNRPTIKLRIAGAVDVPPRQ